MNNTQFWTFNTLVAAFLDLSIAYFLLCGSTVALFAVKFLGLRLPVSCDGSDGIVSFDCRSLLVDYPTDKVSGVRVSATRKFPFDSIFYGVCSCNVEDDLNVELEDEASCSVKSDARKVVGNGIDECVSSSSNWVTCVDQQSNNGEEHVNDCNVSRYHEDVVFGNLNEAQKRIPVNEADKDKMIVLLTRELEETQSARAALYVELEKERNAAASAAEEAMSMILRLQEEKAVVKMESRQYQRMMEEKSAFDAEEMNILKEIVLRREREKHFLEKQVETYRQTICVENDRSNDENNHDLMLHQLGRSRLHENVDFLKQEEPEKTLAIVGEEKGLEIAPDDETGSCVYDVHVISNEPKSPESSEKSHGNISQTDKKQCDTEARIGLPPVSSKSSLGRNSTSALDDERTRLDTEVEWLRERLRIVQEGRVKHNFSVDNLEKESLQMQLLEDIARQLQEIRLLTEPQVVRQASLPLPSSTVGLTKKRRCRSVSSGHAKSS